MYSTTCREQQEYLKQQQQQPQSYRFTLNISSRMSVGRLNGGHALSAENLCRNLELKPICNTDALSYNSLHNTSDNNNNIGSGRMNNHNNENNNICNNKLKKMALREDNWTNGSASNINNMVQNGGSSSIRNTSISNNNSNNNNFNNNLGIKQKHNGNGGHGDCIENNGSDYSSVPRPHLSSQKEWQINIDKQRSSNQHNYHLHNNQNMDELVVQNRPTYGAYTSNTLPRGPYLQYKYNDKIYSSSIDSRNKSGNNQFQHYHHQQQQKQRQQEIQQNNNIIIKHHHQYGNHQEPEINSRSLRTLEQKQQQHYKQRQNISHHIKVDGVSIPSSHQTKFAVIAKPNSFIPQQQQHQQFDAFGNDNIKIKGQGDMVNNNNNHHHHQHRYSQHNDINLEKQLIINGGDGTQTLERYLYQNRKHSGSRYGQQADQRMMFHEADLSKSDLNLLVQQQRQKQLQHLDQMTNQVAYQSLPGDSHKLQINQMNLLQTVHHNGQPRIDLHRPASSSSSSLASSIYSRQSVASNHQQHQQLPQYDAKNQYLTNLRNSNSNLLMEWQLKNGNYNVFGSDQQQRRQRRHHPLSGTQVNDNSSAARSSSQSNYYVTLEEILKVHRKGLNSAEGWALLCQAVQALQDLFLADTPSANRILPLVTPTSFQITCRGRVAFNIMPIGQLGKYKLAEQQGNAGSNTHGPDVVTIIGFLSPEFQQSMSQNQRITFSESDIEKMWIYSLGKVLHRTLPNVDGRSSGTTAEAHEPKPRNGSNNGMRPNHLASTASVPANVQRDYKRTNDGIIEGCGFGDVNYSIDTNTHGKLPTKLSPTATTIPLSPPPLLTPPESSLKHVISSMCNKDLEQRASLMYLLDIISDYCKAHHQVKPFSHIVMELFQEAATNKENVESMEKEDNKDGGHPKAQFDEKSDTDSGRSSDHGDGQPMASEAVTGPPSVPVYPKLEVKRMPSVKSLGRTGGGVTNILASHKPSNALQVVRRKRRRETFRRNTIDVNRLDLEQVQQRLQASDHDLAALNMSKSTNCIDKLLLQERNEFHRKIEEMTFQGGLSLPDLTVAVAEQKLTVKRSTEPQGLKIRKCISTDDFRMEAANDRIRPNCTGPDFIAKSFVPPTQIDIMAATGGNGTTARAVANILLLNGHTIQVVCNPSVTTTRHLLTAIFKTANYVENYFLGLCAIIGGDFIMLPMDLKVYKVAPEGWLDGLKAATSGGGGGGSRSKGVRGGETVYLSLFIRIKFYLPTMRGLNSLGSRHMLYLQLRKSVLEKHIICTDDDLITLGGLALQAEVGDFQENMKYMDYFTISHYLPEDVYQKNRELAKYLRNSHYVKRGLHPLEAEHNFIRYTQELKEFGQHLYSAIWTKDDGTSVDIFLAISISGLCLFERTIGIPSGTATAAGDGDSRRHFQRKCFVKFEWLEIENLCYSKHILCVAVRSRQSLNAKENSRIKYKLRMDGRKSYFAFCLASDHHRFYMKLRNSFVSLKEISDEFNIAIVRPPAEPSTTNSDSEPNSLAVIEGGDGGDGNKATAAKPPKSSGGGSSRLKILKKSMVNDNRLMKLRQRFLKRSKSVMELSMPTNHSMENESGGSLASTSTIVGQQQQQQQQHQQSIPVSPSKSLASAQNRNKVKMGTRAFSTQFLNKSYDNICDNAFNLARLEAAAAGGGGGIHSDSICAGNTSHDMSSLSFDPIDELDCANDDDHHNQRVGVSSTMTAEGRRAPYVLYEQSTLNGDAGGQYSVMPMTEETVSHSLLEKFNNITSTVGVHDRIIRKLVIEKDVQVGAKAHEEAPSPPQQQQPKSAFERLKMATWNSNRFSKRFLLPKKKNKAAKDDDESSRNNREATKQTYSLGISIVQGSDNNVYVKEMVPNGAGDRHGIKIGDQILSVNGKSLLRLSYDESLELLQQSGKTVELTISQIVEGGKNKLGLAATTSALDLLPSSPLYQTLERREERESVVGLPQAAVSVGDVHRDRDLYSTLNLPLMDASAEAEGENAVLADDPVARYFANMRQQHEERVQQRMLDQEAATEGNKPKVLLTTSKSVPDLPKVIATIPKRVGGGGGSGFQLLPTLPRGLGRKYTGPLRYPVTPAKDPLDNNSAAQQSVVGTSRRQLSLPVDQATAGQVYI